MMGKKIAAVKFCMTSWFLHVLRQNPAISFHLHKQVTLKQTTMSVSDSSHLSFNWTI